MNVEADGAGAVGANGGAVAGVDVVVDWSGAVVDGAITVEGCAGSEVILTVVVGTVALQLNMGARSGICNMVMMDVRSGSGGGGGAAWRGACANIGSLQTGHVVFPVPRLADV